MVGVAVVYLGLKRRWQKTTNIVQCCSDRREGEGAGEDSVAQGVIIFTDSRNPIEKITLEKKGVFSNAAFVWAGKVHAVGGGENEPFVLSGTKFAQQCRDQAVGDKY